MPVRRITQDKINKTHNKINRKPRERPRLVPQIFDIIETSRQCSCSAGWWPV